MVFVRLAPDAESASMSFPCESVSVAMAIVHLHVFDNDKACGEVIMTNLPFPFMCGCDYTHNGNFSADNMTDSVYERFYNTKLY